MMRKTHSPPRHSKRPRHARASGPLALKLVAVTGLLTLVSLVFTLVVPLGAIGSTSGRGPGGTAPDHAHKRKPAPTSTTLGTTTSAVTTTIRQTTTTTAASTTTATTVQSTSSPTTAGPGVGVQFHGMWSEYTDGQRLTVLDKLAAAHVGWIRVDMSWIGFEGSCRGCYNQWYLNRANFVVDAARARGLKVLVTLWRTPGWANGGAGELVPPTNAADFGRIAGWVAARFKGRVSAYEIWNEPDSGAFFRGTLDQYVGLLRAAYPAVRSADPGASVVLGGPINNETTWLDSVYRAGAAPYFDVLATHPYMSPSDLPPETADTSGTNIYLLSHVAAVRKLMVSKGDSAKPIWFTEFGWSAHPNSGTEPSWMRGVTTQQQADYTVRAIRFVRSNFPYVTNMFIYNDRNRRSGNVQVDNYGILYRDLSDKPVYTALRAMLGA